MDLNCYDILGVPRNANQATIDSAYLARLRLTIQASESRQIAADVVLLTRAYIVLVETGRRAAYDHGLTYAAMMHEGYDATYEVTVDTTEARVGTSRTLTFHEPDGHPYGVTVSIPPNSRAGDYIRVAGAGGPSVDGSCRGDLLVKLIVTHKNLP
jgi:DnaJ-class molecular chaperone